MKQSKGFIRLEWTCPNCGARNPGPQKTCASCGAPQPENVQFERGASNDFIADDAEIKRAAGGADIHCAYCGARNPAGAQTCSQCGGNLAEGVRRQSGRELAAAVKQPDVTCANCGQVNPGAQAKCAKCGAPLPRTNAAPPPAPAPAPQPAALPAATAHAGNPPQTPKALSRRNIIIAAVIAFLLCCCCGAFFALANLPRETVTASVESAYWQTTVPVQEEREVNYTNQSGSPPSGAYNVDCRTETRQVCTERTVDLGNGYAEVVEECRDETEQYCSYDIREWQTIREDKLEGSDTSPLYPRPSLRSGQREGKSSITLRVTFVSGSESYTYTPGDVDEFQQFSPGSQWRLSISWLGNIVSVEPAR